MARSSNGESVFSRVVRILEAFGPERPVLGVAELSRRTGLSLATTSRLVSELVEHGWLERGPDRRLTVGMRLWEVASRASPALGLREAAMPVLEDVHAVVGHHTQLSVLEGREVLFVERLSAPGAVINVTRVAGRLPVNASSSGLVLLAHAPAAVQEEVLAGPLESYTPHTPTGPGKLRALLAEVRRTGVAVCPGFIDERATGVAVPIRLDGRVVAAVSVIVPNDGGAHAQIPLLQAAARGIARAMRPGQE
ncbi:IclR family transcriptional regulator [Thermobifida halotolerans]|uniref:IclR family transcriptional regulator n=1 Tax=Thermobifida halotolerans TaxID=483545 RepID=A0A399G9M0_9ACTN|nr:IclR family transcriptional regulator [Thermobifida halotolerans]UOE21153.1 IclR family transcriptional regulator [Thermobifida halotolerans]